MKTRNPWLLFWSVILTAIGTLCLTPVARGAEWEMCGSRIEAAYKAACLGEISEVRPTGSNAAYWGNLPGFLVLKKIIPRNARRGMMVVRRDMNICHLVDTVEGPLVYTRGASNHRRDATAVSGDLYLVTHAFFYKK